MALKIEHTLLLVDDEKSITKALHRLFRKEGYHTITAESGPEGLQKLEQSERPVSLIISDQRMPEMNGAQFLEKAKDIAPNALRFLLTGYSDMQAVMQAVNKGEIHRYLTKPWNDEDLLLHVRHSLEHFELVYENRRLTALTIKQNRELAEFNKSLEMKVEARTREVFEKNKALEESNRQLEKSFMNSIRLLVSMVETLNPRLGGLMRKVARMARQIGESLDLSGEDLDKIEMAGLIHDIGLLGFPDELWNKDIKHMSEEQLRMFNEHPVIGSIILESVDRLGPVAEMILFHHEHVNGQGFPNGLTRQQIPLGSRILLVASDYVRIVETWPRDLQKLMSMARRHFDPEVWKSFMVSDDPEAIIEEAAEKTILMEANQRYDMEVVSALIKSLRKAKKVLPTYSLSLTELKEGMMLMEDLRLTDGRLLLTKGTKLKGTSIASIKSIGERGLLTGHLNVSVPGEEQEA
ncbi:MAG: response regulator [Desulfosarcinaceae bacterium]